MKGLLAEGAKVLEEKMTPEVRDAALVAAAQRVEHYEMAVYGTLRTYARELADLDSARLLQATLDEEADADRTLTQLAEFSINLLAAAETAVAR
jgi:ferritin-like metal-binding protein YciE